MDFLFKIFIHFVNFFSHEMDKLCIWNLETCHLASSLWKPFLETDHKIIACLMRETSGQTLQEAERESNIMGISMSVNVCIWKCVCVGVYVRARAYVYWF